MKTTILIILFLCSGNIFAQSGYNCPGNLSNANNDTEQTIDTILTSDDFNDLRSSNGISYLKYINRTLLTSSSYSCNRLNDFVNTYLDQNQNESYNYYKAGSYYFIVAWRPNKSTGIKNIYFLDSNYKLKKVWGI